MKLVRAGFDEIQIPESWRQELFKIRPRFHFFSRPDSVRTVKGVCREA